MTVAIVPTRLTRILIAGDETDRLRLVRAAVTADVIRRLVEVRGGQAVLLSTVELPDLLAYNVPPPSRIDPGRPPDIVVGDSSVGPPLVAVGPVIGEANAGADPLAVRLALLVARHADPVTLDADTVTSADLRLHRWRRLVADWAARPSASMPPAYVAQLIEGAVDDLDVSSLLAVLDAAAADEAVPPGGRFELLLYADRILALDVVADLHS